MADINVNTWQMEIDARAMFAFLRPNVLALANDDIGFALDAFLHASAAFASLLANALCVGNLRRGKQDGERRRTYQRKSAHGWLLLPLPIQFQFKGLVPKMVQACANGIRGGGNATWNRAVG